MVGEFRSGIQLYGALGAYHPLNSVLCRLTKQTAYNKDGGESIVPVK
jgi:hypothetical protein